MKFCVSDCFSPCFGGRIFLFEREEAETKFNHSFRHWRASPRLDFPIIAMALPGAGGISLKVVCNVSGVVQEKTFRFSPDLAVWEASKEISEKLNVGGADHALFQAASGSRKGRWLKPNITLKAAELLSGVRTPHTRTHTHFLRALLAPTASSCRTLTWNALIRMAPSF